MSNSLDHDAATCQDCKRPLRPSRVRDDEKFPGTVRYAAKGKCNSCYRAWHRSKAPTPERDTTTEINRGHLNAWLARTGRKPLEGATI